MRRKSESQPPTTKYQWLPDLEARYGRGRRQLKRWIAEGILPAPDIIVNNHEGWKESTLDESDRRHTIEAGATTEFGRRRKPLAAE
jgi:hypothetical protein